MISAEMNGATHGEATPDDHQRVAAMIPAIARKIRDAGMAAPAIFMLELNKPLSGIISAAGTAFRPLLVLLAGTAKIDLLLALFSSPDLTELLMSEIERAHAPREGAP